MNKIVLDTNAYIAFLAGDEEVLTSMARAGIVFLSVFVLGELEAGFRGGERETFNRGILESFLAKPTVRILNATAATAETFGRIKTELRKAGAPLPINDVWIAAHALETESTLVSYDRHFMKIAGLKVWP